MTPLRHGAIALIRVYQWILSPVLPMSCRFEPSCSHYACEAIARHGALYGAGLALWRILRCNPWGGSGYDPVPGADPEHDRQHRHDHPHDPA
jgi:putative membrane protein insertion efficiency factor